MPNQDQRPTDKAERPSTGVARPGVPARECSQVFQGVPEDLPRDVPQCSGVFQDVPGCSGAFPRTENDKTNPTRPRLASRRDVERLTPRQLAAARALVRGISTVAVAQRLHTTRQTINRWRRRPDFANELRRLHDLLMQSTGPSASAPRTAPRAAPRAARVPARPMSKREADEVEDLIARMLGGKS
jgi:hypothetical protein